MRSIAVVVEMNENEGMVVDILDSYEEARKRAEELNSSTGKNYDIYYKVIDDDGRGTTEEIFEVQTVWN